MMVVSTRTKVKRIIFKLFSVLLLSHQCLCLDPARKQSVTTVLNAKWSLTPFALETSEYLGEIKNQYFWALVDFLAEDEIVNRKCTDEEFHEKLMEFSSRYFIM